MRIILMVLLLVVASAGLLRAQDSTRLERYEYVLGATAAYSLIDYYGFNVIATEWHDRSVYRVLEAGVQAAITYFLYKELGLSSAISFNLIWWTWGTDLAYYGWANALNSFAWEGRTHTGLMSQEIDWAGWTPIGLLRPRGSLIARDALLAQAMIGFSVSMAILW